MSIWEEHRDEYYLEQAMKKADRKLDANIKNSYKKVLAQAILEMKRENNKNK